MVRDHGPDGQVDIEAIVRADIEAQQAIKGWEAERHRLRAVLEPHLDSMGVSWVDTDAGSFGWQGRTGTIDWRAVAFYACGQIRKLGYDQWAESVLAEKPEVLDEYRGQPGRSFHVKPRLKVAPAIIRSRIEGASYAISRIERELQSGVPFGTVAEQVLYALEDEKAVL